MPLIQINQEEDSEIQESNNKFEMGTSVPMIEDHFKPPC